MAVQINGDFITINEKITVKLSEIISIKPVSMVSVQQFTGKIIGKDFPKIVISTYREELEILYSTDEERDNALAEIRKIMSENPSNQNNFKNMKDISINVSDSSNVNVVSQSSNVEINQDIKHEANSKINELIDKINKDKEIDSDSKSEILECVNDIKENLNSNKKVPKYSLKALLDLTSNFASISSLGIGIAQLFGAQNNLHTTKAIRKKEK